jgi:CHAT domain-containing protein
VIFLSVALLADNQKQRKSGRDRPRFHWCPSGQFSFIPLHAAGDYRTNPGLGCSDYVVSSYIPSIGALMKAKHGLRAILKIQAKAVLIDEAVAPGFPRLHGVKEEIDVVERLLETNGLDSSRIAHIVGGATVERVIHRLQDASIVHFACHGMEDDENPLKSGFKLRDGTLTIEDLMRLNMPKALFAFLSACETAKGNQKQPDYNVHLSAAMLFVGFRSVIGTLWFVPV